ncbi:MAG: hypothetical protein WBG65_14190, partial [Sulfurimonadaceae bacterium]
MIIAKKPLNKTPKNPKNNKTVTPKSVGAPAEAKRGFESAELCSKRAEKSSAFEASLLVNGEIGKRVEKFAHVYKKYSRKHTAQYALTVGNTKENINTDLKTINVSLCHCGIQPHYSNQDGFVEIK